MADVDIQAIIEAAGNAGATAAGATAGGAMPGASGLQSASVGEGMGSNEPPGTDYGAEFGRALDITGKAMDAAGKLTDTAIKIAKAATGQNPVTGAPPQEKRDNTSGGSSGPMGIPWWVWAVGGFIVLNKKKG